MHIKTAEKAKLFIGVMYKKGEHSEEVLKELINKYRKIWMQSEEIQFSFTDYYADEMGKDLVKKFFVFEKPIDRSKIGKIKQETNNLEDKYTKNRKRMFNLDPGYVNKTQLVLASAKESGNKIYLGKGMFAHLTYIYANKQWNPTERCFPDFRSDNVKSFFHIVRENL